MIFSTRRVFAGGAAAAFLAACVPTKRLEAAMEELDPDELYGLIGEIKAAPGKGRELAEILLEASSSRMPGNLAYLVSVGAEQPDSVWVSEVWTSKQAHDDSLHLPAVQAAIARARPIIGGFGTRVETKPLGGAGM